MSENRHPGIYLAEELRRRGWNQTDLTFILGCHPKAVNQIINGKQGVSPAMSKALGEALGLTPDYFADLQKAYDLATASAPDPAVSLRARLASAYPIREMLRRGWLSSDQPDELSQELARFFEVDEPGNIPHLTHSAKKSRYSEEITPSQLAWLYRVRQIAKRMVSPKYSKQYLENSTENMRSLLMAPEEARHVPRVLHECGVRFVIVEPLPQLKIDGVCFWLDDHAPVIGLSMRFDRIDNFWFVVRHEIEHVIRGDGRNNQGMVDAELQGEGASVSELLPSEERIANAAAADFCIPTGKIESFIARKSPLFYEKDVLAFSRLNGVHPGLAIGQLQHRTGRYDYLKKYQVKIRQFVLPGAMVDGWGQTAMSAGA